MFTCFTSKKKFNLTVKKKRKQCFYTRSPPFSSVSLRGLVNFFSISVCSLVKTTFYQYVVSK